MNNQRHPDIEIYIKTRPLAGIENWLSTLGQECVSSVSSEPSGNKTHEYTLTIDGESIPVFVHEKAAGKAWTSVWFQSDKTPWEKDLDCARVASLALQAQVRCIATGWTTGDDPDEWWKVEDEVEELITWTSA
jgi:hypothetical protein